MDAFSIVESEIGIHPLPSLDPVGVVVQVNFLIFDTSPQPFGEDVVNGPPATVHADPHVVDRGDRGQLVNIEG